MKFEPDMYARFEDGRIGIIKNLAKYYNSIEFDKNTHVCILFKDSSYPSITLKEFIVKTSYEISQIIEKGDYVNGVYVNEIKDNRPYHEDYNDPYYSYYLDEDDIKTIATKEQFDLINYKLK